MICLLAWDMGHRDMLVGLVLRGSVESVQFQIPVEIGIWDIATLMLQSFAVKVILGGLRESWDMMGGS